MLHFLKEHLNINSANNCCISKSPSVRCPQKTSFPWSLKAVQPPWRAVSSVLLRDQGHILSCLQSLPISTRPLPAWVYQQQRDRGSGLKVPGEAVPRSVLRVQKPFAGLQARLLALDNVAKPTVHPLAPPPPRASISGGLTHLACSPILYLVCMDTSCSANRVQPKGCYQDNGDLYPF